MPQSTALQPTQNHEQPSTCATCPYFSNYYDRERGLCEVFDKVFKKHNLRTSDCDLQIESLLKQPKTCTVSVHLITEAVEDDGYGYAVPIDSQTVEINVAQPLKGLVETEIASRKDLQGWLITRFWQPDGGFEI